MQNLGQDRRQPHTARNTIFVRKCETAHHDDSSTNRHEMHRSRHTTCHKREWSYALNNSHKANSLFITFRPLPLSRQLGGSVSSVHVLSRNGSQFEKTIYFHFDCNWQWPADCFSLFIILFCCHDLSLAWLTYQRFVDCANGQTKFTADSIRIRQRRSKELWHMVQVPFICAIYLNHLIFTRRVRKIDWSKEIRHSTVNTFHRLIVERTHSNSTPRRVNESTTANGWNWRRLLVIVYQFRCAGTHGENEAAAVVVQRQIQSLITKCIQGSSRRNMYVIQSCSRINVLFTFSFHSVHLSNSYVKRIKINYDYFVR